MAWQIWMGLAHWHLLRFVNDELHSIINVLVQVSPAIALEDKYLGELMYWGVYQEKCRGLEIWEEINVSSASTDYYLTEKKSMIVSMATYFHTKTSPYCTICKFIIGKFYRKTHCLTCEFRAKFHSKNHYRIAIIFLKYNLVVSC